MKQLSRSAQVYDIRTKYGATSTILIEYLMELKIEIDIPLATALLYAIRSDTQDLGREATQADILAIEKLYPIANKRMLSLIQRGRVPKVYFSMLAKALKNAIICGNAIVTHLGSIDNPDMIGEVADLLLREDKTVWTMCTGIFEERFLLSIRTSDQNNRADKVIKLVVGRKGSGGGHLTYSGGQIPLKNLKRIKTNQLEEKLEKKFLKIIGIDESKKESLIDF
jgi:nanoRNase/pAp phosphatase (c-di-AMP/oligoRNAs hydrolase)